MGKKTYLLSFDPHRTDAIALHQVIKNSRLISGWSHYLGSTYLLVSREPLQNIHNEIKTKWPNQRYFIAEINPENKNGWLPKDAWSWIQRST